MADDNPFAQFAQSVPGTTSGDNPFAEFANAGGSIPTIDYYNNFANGSGGASATSATADANGRSFALTRPATPDAPTWWGRRLQDIEGRQDPDYANTPSVYSQNPDLLQAPMGSAAMLGATDDQMTDVVKKQLGDRFIGTFKDANGYPLVRFNDRNGQPQTAYVNRPGLDREDVVRGIKGALPYAAAGEVLGPVVGGLRLLPRMLSAGATGFGMSAAGDVAMKPLGNEQGIDQTKAGTMAILGPLAEAGGAGANYLWKQLVTIPKYFDKSTGQLTPLGRQAAQSMGLDPNQMASDAMSKFGKTYAMNPQAAKASVDAGTFDFNIPATRGQIAKDPQQLMQEKAMRSGLYGLDAKNQIEDLDARQAAAIENAVTETIPSRLAGRRYFSGGQSQDVFGNNIGLNFADARANAKVAERAAWDAAPDVSPLPGATDLLPPIIGKRLNNISVFDEVNTPTAYQMGEQVHSFMQGKAPTTKLDATLGISRPQTIDALRKQLSQLRANAQTPTDQAAASAIYHGYNDWIDEAARQSLLSGDPIAAANLKAARDVSAEINQIFRPQQGGQLTPGGKILQQIAKSADTPERIVSALIPSPNSQIQPGTIEALNLIKRGLQKFGSPGAESQVWNSIKMGYLSKLTQGRNGEILSPQVMGQNLRKALNSQTSLFNTIFAPSDRAVLTRFIGQLNRVTWKDPNPSGTATGVAGLTKQLFGTLLDSFGGLGRAAWDFSGIQHAWGSNIARRAVQQIPAALPRAVPNAALNYSNAVLSPLAIQGNQQPQ